MDTRSSPILKWGGTETTTCRHFTGKLVKMKDRGKKCLKAARGGKKKHVFKRSIIRLMADFPKKQWKPKTIKGHI